MKAPRSAIEPAVAQKETADYEAQIEAVLARSEADFAEGRFYDDLATFKSAVRKERSRKAAAQD